MSTRLQSVNLCTAILELSTSDESNKEEVASWPLRVYDFVVFVPFCDSLLYESI